MKHIDTRTRMVKTYTVELSAEEARAIHALLNRLGPDDAIYGRGDEGPDTRLLEPAAAGDLFNTFDRMLK